MEIGDPDEKEGMCPQDEWWLKLEEEQGKRCTCHQGSKCAYCMMRDGDV